MAERCKEFCDSSSADACEQRRPKLKSREKANDKFMKRHALCDSVLTCERNRSEVEDSMGNEIWSIYNDKYFEI